MTSQTTERNDQERRQQERESKERQAQLHDQNYLQANAPTTPPGGSFEAQTAWQAYFDLVDQSTRTARRVAEAMFIRSQIQEIAQEVRRQLLIDVRTEVQHQMSGVSQG